MNNQCGFATLEFTAGVALLMIPMLLLVTLLPTWSEAHQAATTAADVGARAAAIAVAERGDPVAAAGDAAAVVLAARGVTGTVTLDEATAERVVVTVSVPLSAIPVIGGSGSTETSGSAGSRTASGDEEPGGLTTSATAVVLVDPFRAPDLLPADP